MLQILQLLRPVEIALDVTYNGRMPAKKTVVLVILDGWGLAPADPGNAVAKAHTPTFERIWKQFPHTTLDASGEAVGLPHGQMGNSEVGHTNLGAGRVVYQPSAQISKAIRNGDFFVNKVLLEAMHRARESRLHLMGLISDGGVHSQLDHLLALLELAKREKVNPLYVHAFMDGRDTSPTSGGGYLKTVEAKLSGLGLPTASIATVMGRYWAMDRDKRWERTNRAFRALRFGEGERWKGSATVALQSAYQKGETDEFIQPIVLETQGRIEDGDAVIFLNFRPDRARQLSHAFVDADFQGFDRQGQPLVHFVGMTRYEESLTMAVAFPPMERLKNTLGEVISLRGWKQLRCAETEKYAHVTYFFNNMREEPFVGEDRQLIPSPKVATYDLQPEMSVPQVARLTAERIRSGQYAFVLVNFANPDMVGHTGVFQAAVQAVQATDVALGVVLEAVEEVGGEGLVLADHGNAECMLQPDGSAHTAHTTNPVPCIYVGRQSVTLRSGGALCDVAPTLLRLLEIPQPREMSGRCLIQP